MTVLVEGKIPAGTECPFRNECNEAKNGDCGHQGVNHTVPYSCGYARLFNIFTRDPK
jgi:hypothetical protein